MKTVILTRERSVIDEYMNVLRNVDQQSDRERFRKNLHRLGFLTGYEISKTMSFNSGMIETPLAMHEQSFISDEVVVVTILRAGLPFHDGLLNAFPGAENGFISAYRKHDGEDFSIEVEYVACPDLSGKQVILNDPMLATGQSFVNAWHALSKYGKPKQLHLASVIGSEEGVAYVEEQFEDSTRLWITAVDPELNDYKYIVPGLGDAGDLSFGTKLQR